MILAVRFVPECLFSYALVEMTTGFVCVHCVFVEDAGSSLASGMDTDVLRRPCVDSLACVSQSDYVLACVCVLALWMH